MCDKYVRIIISSGNCYEYVQPGAEGCGVGVREVCGVAVVIHIYIYT